MALFSRKEYWDERYLASQESCVEWYQSYHSLRHLLNPIHFAAHGNGVRTWNLHRSVDTASSAMIRFPTRDICRVLILGCGNSRCAQDMRQDGWAGKITNLDFSAVVIEQMKERYRHEATRKDNQNTHGTCKLPPGGEESNKMEFVCHDMTTGLPFSDESFDLIICKGSFDAVLTSSCPVADIRTVVQESVRCLARGHGIFFVVTNGNPDSRLVYLEHQNDINFYWDGVSCHTVPRLMSHETDHVLICRRRLHPVAVPAPAAPIGKPTIVDGKENADNKVAGSTSTDLTDDVTAVAKASYLTKARN